MDEFVHIAFPFLLGSLLAGAGTYIVWGRRMVTKNEHKEYCNMRQDPVEQKLLHLKEGQGRVESKVDKLNEKVDKTLEVLHKMNGGD